MRHPTPSMPMPLFMVFSSGTGAPASARRHSNHQWTRPSKQRSPQTFRQRRPRQTAACPTDQDKEPETKVPQDCRAHMRRMPSENRYIDRRAQPGQNNREQNRKELKDSMRSSQVLTEKNNERDGQATHAPMKTSYGSTKLEQAQTDEGDGWCDGDRSHEAQHLSDQAGITENDFDQGPSNDCALDMLHLDLPADIFECRHAANRKGRRQERKSTTLNDGQTVAEGRLQDRGDATDKKHRADKPTDGDRIVLDTQSPPSTMESPLSN